jgi:hypothetical protein
MTPRLRNAAGMETCHQRFETVSSSSPNAAKKTPAARRYRKIVKIIEIFLL